MAVSNLISQPQFVKPNYSAGDKAAAVFGNEWGMQNKQNEANFQNNLNMINYANDVNRQNMIDAPSLKVQGMTKAGINPLAAAGSVAGAQLSPSGNSSPNGDLGQEHGIFDVISDVLSGVTKIIKASSSGKK